MKCPKCENEEISKDSAYCKICGSKIERKSSKYSIIKMIKEYFICVAILISIQLVWMGLEMIIYGHIKPDKADGIIAFILMISLYFNIEHILSRRAVIIKIKKVVNKDG